jgi:hypothetical protein
VEVLSPVAWVEVEVVRHCLAWAEEEVLRCLALGEAAESNGLAWVAGVEEVPHWM